MALTPQIHIWALAAAFLFFKLMSNTAFQTLATLRTRHVYLPEDARMMGAHGKTQESELSQRASFCWENDLENIPIFLFLLLAYALLDGDPAWCSRFAIVFCASRALHGFCMIRGVQPWRTVAYVVGVTVCFGLSAGILRLAL